MLRQRIAAGVVVATLAAFAWFVPDLRKDLIRAVVKYDAVPGDPAPLPAGMGAGLPRAARTRVILVDGLAAPVAATLPAWSALCKSGVTLRVDVGFPTVSLPVETALWTGLTQQQSGIVYRADRPLDPPLGPRGIPAQIPGSIAIAESHGWIVRSLGFATTEPAAAEGSRVKDADPEGWKTVWEERALAAVKTDARLVFVHILRVDDAGHASGLGEEYGKAAHDADAIVARLVAADREARWFVLSDHGHLPAGGHGGEERAVRQVQACLAGPGIPVGRGELVHLVDVSRAIADSTGAVLDPESRGRPLAAALASPLVVDQAVPAMPLGNGAIAIFLIVAGLGLSTWGVRRWWLAPWWFIAACGALFVVRGEPTLSMRMIYAPEGRDMYVVWLPALAVATVATWIGLRGMTLARVVVAQLALPIAAAAAAITAAGGWPALLGREVAPVVPHFTAWMSPLVLMAAHGAAAVALAVLATLVRPRSDRRAPAETLRSEPAAAE
jgi:hypothetical protein